MGRARFPTELLWNQFLGNGIVEGNTVEWTTNETHNLIVSIGKLARAEDKNTTLDYNEVPQCWERMPLAKMPSLVGLPRTLAALDACLQAADEGMFEAGRTAKHMLKR